MSRELDLIQPGDIVGPYRIVRGFHGQGGMARIFEAEVRKKYRQPNMPRRLALKVAWEQHQAALAAEVEFLRRFDHPNVIQIFPLPRGDNQRQVYAARERFSFGWGWYYAMELLDGGGLHEHLTRTTAITDLLNAPSDRQRRLSELNALGIARQLAAALEHIHEQQVINLDVKPGNVLFRHRSFRFLRGSVPQAVLCDFGIARDVRYPRTGQLGIATPEYVSPEQAMELDRSQRPVDARSDIFSLGIVLYEMLTGQLPFENVGLVLDPTYVPAAPRQLRPSISPALEEIIMKALAKNPGWRFQTASEMRMALEQIRTLPDWQAAARRTLAGVTLVASLTGAGWGVSSCLGPSTPTPTRAHRPATVQAVTPTPTVVPTTMPALPTASPTPTSRPPTTTPPQRATSTPAPTLTVTPTPVPTATPTSTPEQTETISPSGG